MVEKVRCFKDLRVGCDTYYFVYGDSPKPPKGVLIGFIYFVDDETEISIKDDSLVVPHLVEMMYDCLDDKKSFKVKFQLTRVEKYEMI